MSANRIELEVEARVETLAAIDDFVADAMKQLGTEDESYRVQLAVKQCILSIVVLDAAICLAVRSPVWWAVGIVMLLVPTLFLGRWIEST